MERRAVNVYQMNQVNMRVLQHSHAFDFDFDFDFSTTSLTVDF